MLGNASQRDATNVERVIQTYRAFIRKEMESGNISETLDRIQYEDFGSLEAYRLSSVNLVDVYVLLEYLMFPAKLRQACHNMRREVCRSVETSNKRRYREPSCNFGIQNRQQFEELETILEEVCDESTHKDFKAFISAGDFDDRPEVPAFKTSKPVSTRDGSVIGTREQPSDYLSPVMPLISFQFKYEWNRRREKLIGNYSYRNDDQADFQDFHACPSMDEYCYPVLSEEILARRNADQTLVRFYRPENADPLFSDPFDYVTVIDPIWIWLIDDVLIYTSQSDERIFEVPSGLNADTSSMQIGHFLADSLESSGINFILDAFQGYIVKLTEEVSSYTDREGMESMTIQAEKQFYHNINDVREELSMFRRVLSQQEEVWGDFASNAWPEMWADSQGGRMRHSPDSQYGIKPEVEKSIMRLIMRPKLRIQKSLRRISQLDEDAERVERSVAIQLDLKQKYASLRESHATAVMSTAVFGFTIITIIFTPLSFIMSLFALPIDRFQDNQIPSRWTSDAGMYSTNYVGTWIATTEIASIVLTGIAMWLALEYGLKYPLRLKIWTSLENLSKRMYDLSKYSLDLKQLLSHALKRPKSKASQASRDDFAEKESV